MVVLNNNTEIQTIKTNRFQENIQGIQTGKEVLTGKIIDLKSEINIAPLTVYILELE